MSCPHGYGGYYHAQPLHCSGHSEGINRYQDLSRLDTMEKKKLMFKMVAEAHFLQGGQIVKELFLQV